MGVATLVQFRKAPNRVNGAYLLRPVLEMQGRDSAGSYSWSVWVTGDAGLLACGVLAQEVPIGILLDRLEECPEEAGGESIRLRECIEHLRWCHPNGV